MTTLQQLFELASLSQASYAFITSDADDQVQVAVKDGRLAPDQFGLDQANQLIGTSGFSVIHHIQNDAYGFSATLFSDNRTGEKTLAIRGSEGGLLDFLPTGGSDPDRYDANADIVYPLRGIARNQFISLYNLIRQLEAPTNVEVPFYRLVDTSIAPSSGAYYEYLVPRGLLPDERRYVYLQFDHVEFGLGLTSGSLSLTGHSLGGHLSMALARLFPGLISKVHAFNAPGFQEATSREILPLFELLARNEGIPTSNVVSFPDEKIKNLYAYNGPEIVTNTAVFQQPGERRGIFIESHVDTITALHSVSRLSDALAIYQLFERVGPQVGTTDETQKIAAISRILEAAEYRPDRSLEVTLDTLRRLFSDGLPIATTTIGNRDEFYQKLYDANLEQRIASYQGQLSFVGLTESTATDIANIARGSTAFAFRYALQELNPFALVGNDNLYASHSINGELDIHDPVNRTGAITSEWLTDRAAFLTWKNEYFTTDGATLFSTRNENYLFEHRDRAGKSDLALTVVGALAAGGNGGASLNPAKVIFGNRGPDAINGGILSDRLYGDDGPDWLEGKAENDYIEGGRGLDIYSYWVLNAGVQGHDGFDVIRDVDGRGLIRVSHRTSTYLSTAVTGPATTFSGGRWLTPDGFFAYTTSSNDQGRIDLLVETPLGGSITIKDWQYGDFGIRLWAPRSEPETGQPHILGDLQPVDFDPTTAGIQTQNDALGNVIVTVNPEPDRNDTLNDSTGNDRIIAGGGTDLLRGIRGGDDWMSGDAGRDNIQGGFGADLIEGGADGQVEGEFGGDMAFGDEGDDELYGDSKIALAQAILEGNTGAAGNIKGDYLSGGGGADWIVGAAGHDYLDGGSGQDLIVGGAGDDNIGGDWGYVAISPLWIVEREIIPQDDVTVYSLNFVAGSVSGLDGGEGAADVIYAGAGVDWIYADAGDDFIDNGPGDDVAFGMQDDDVLLGGLGNDILVGDNGSINPVVGNDYLDGGEGDDHLQGNAGQDILIGATGNDTLVGGTGKDMYVFNKGDGRDSVFDVDDELGTVDASVLILGDGITRSQIKFRVGSLAVDMGQADPDDPDSPRDIVHFSGFDQMDPTASMPLAEIRFSDGAAMSYADILEQGFDIDGTEGDDNNVPGEPAGNIVGTGVTDRINGLGGNDLIFGLRGNDVLDGGEGSDELLGGPGADTLHGGAGNDAIWGDVEANGIFAPSGGDVIYAGAGNDVVQGNDADDQIFGEDDSDSLYGDFGADVVDGGAGDDFLYGQGYFFLGGIPYLNLFDDAAPDTLRGGDGNDYLNAAAGDDLLEGGSGADTLEGEAGADHLIGGEGNDSLWGDKSDSGVNAGNDTLDGGSGTDQLAGYQGNDTYVFGLGHGQDTIFDHDTTPGNMDVVNLAADITPDDVTAQLSGTNLVLTVNGTTDTLTIANQYFSTADRVEEIRFTDGTVWTPETTPILIQGTVGNNTLNGTSGPDVFESLAGNDTMTGGAGNDTYRIFRGDGSDVITDFDATPGNTDKIIYSPDIQSNEVQAVRNNNDLLLRLSGTADQITVMRYFENDGMTPNSIEQISFLADGTTWDVATVKSMVLTGTSNSETIRGYTTDDVLSGLEGNDWLLANAGNDTLIGGTGNDQLDGGTGNDTYLIALSDGQDTITDVDSTAGNVDRLIYSSDILPSDIQVARSGESHLLLKVNGTTNYVQIGGYFENDGVNPNLIEEVQFSANGTTWDVATVKLLALTGTEGNDTLVGYASNDTLTGLGGHDVLDGGDGNDTFDGGAGNDYMKGWGGDDEYRIYRGSGFDQIYDPVGTADRVVYAADILPSQIKVSRDASSGHTLLSLMGTSDVVVLQNYYDQNPPWVVDEIRFLSDGAVWDVATVKAMAITPTGGQDVIVGYGTSDYLSGLGGHDFIYGGVGNDTLDGGAGDDFLYGEEGSDTYLFGSGYGADQIYNHLSGLNLDNFGSTDVLLFVPGVFPSQISTSKSGSDLRLQIAGTSDVITIKNYFLGGLSAIEEIRFSDGTVWTDQTIGQQFAINGTADSDNIVGTSLSEIINGLAGNDTISGGSDGHDTIDGGLGGDRLFGGLGNDILIAGNGDSKNSKVSNLLRGGSGNDVLIASGNYLDNLLGDDGNDIYIGGANRDLLQDTGGNNVMFGGAASDFIDMGDQGDIVMGGTGDDFIDGDNSNINGIRGREILAFNKTDGKDIVNRLGAGSTISIGGGTLYGNLSLVASSGLQLKVGNSSISLNGWYDTPGEKTVSLLQIVIEGSRDYKPASSTPMNNKKIHVFDFTGLVNAFDAARAAGQTFNVASNLESFRLWSSDTEAIGGAIAYQYARTGTLGTLTYDEMRAVVSDPAFAISAQPIAPVAQTTSLETSSQGDVFAPASMETASLLEPSDESASRNNAITSSLGASAAALLEIEQDPGFSPETEARSPSRVEPLLPDHAVMHQPDHLLVPQLAFATAYSAMPTSLDAKRNGIREDRGVFDPATATLGRPSIGDALWEDGTRATRLSEDGRVRIAEVHENETAQEHDDALNRLAGAWFSRLTRDEDLTQLDDIGRADHAIDPKSHASSISARWRRVHESYGYGSSGESDLAEGSDVGSLPWRGGAAAFEVTRSVVGLSGVAGHELKLFSGLKEGISILAS